MHQYVLESRLSEKVLMVLMGNQLNMSQQCAPLIKETNSILWSLSISVDGRCRGMIISLATGETSSGLLCPVLGSAVQETWTY